MSCFHPNYMIYNNGQLGQFGGKLTQAKIDSKLPGQEFVPVPCGKCVGCRLDKAKHWSDRMLLEFATEREYQPKKKALFVTLTYDDENVPWIIGTDGLPYRSLNPVDTQLWLKRFRKSVWEKYHRRIRFYLAGEYGDHTFRPHYHVIIFGLGMDDLEDAQLYSHDVDMDTDLYISPWFDALWSLGQCKLAPACYSTFAYVGRYVIKKQYAADFSRLIYRGRVPPFNRVSRRPGLGADYFASVDSPQVWLSDGSQVHQIGVPRIVWDKLHLTDPETYDILKSQQRNIAHERNALIENQLSKSYLDYLSDCEKAYLSRTKILGTRTKV